MYDGPDISETCHENKTKQNIVAVRIKRKKQRNFVFLHLFCNRWMKQLNLRQDEPKVSMMLYTNRILCRIYM